MLEIIDLLVPLAIVVCALWPLCRAIVSPAFWRCFRKYALMAAGIVLVGVASVVTTAVYFPPVQWLVAVCALVVWLFEAWRGRSNFGSARGLPPGSLRRFPSGFWEDHLFFLKRAYKYGRVFKTSQFIHPMVCIVDLQLGLDLLRQHDQSLLQPPMKFDRIVPGGFLCYMPDPDHSRYRPMIANALSRDVVERQRASMGAYFAQQIQYLCDDPALSRHGDNLLQCFKDLIFYLWLQLFFGIDEREESVPKLYALYQSIDISNLNKTSVKRGQAYVNEIVDTVGRAISKRRSNGSGVHQCVNLIDEIQLENGGAEYRKVIMGNLAYILYTSNTDMASLFHWLVKMLSDHPHWLTRLQQDATPGSGDDQQRRRLAECTVMETLRLEQSEYLYRAAHCEVRIGDYVIPKGWLIRICVREAHRHREGFVRAGEFDPERFMNGRPDSTRYLPFGGFSRGCPASHFAVAVATEFVVALTSNFRWEVVEDGPRELNEWMHWAPSSRFRIRLERRASHSS